MIPHDNWVTELLPESALSRRGHLSAVASGIGSVKDEVIGNQVTHTINPVKPDQAKLPDVIASYGWRDCL